MYLFDKLLLPKERTGVGLDTSRGGLQGLYRTAGSRGWLTSLAHVFRLLSFTRYYIAFSQRHSSPNFPLSHLLCHRPLSLQPRRPGSFYTAAAQPCSAPPIYKTPRQRTAQIVSFPSMYLATNSFSKACRRPPHTCSGLRERAVAIDSASAAHTREREA